MGLCSPGRFHVSNVVKLIAIYFVMNFDCVVEDEGGMSFEFRDVLVPNPKCEVVVRRRVSE